MTRVKQPITCDFCAKQIESQMRYTIQANQIDEEKASEKGSFVTLKNKADMCHKCFLNICQNGVVPKWIKKSKDEQTGKWNDHELEEQATL